MDAEKMSALLKRLEWSGGCGYDTESCCPDCGKEVSYGSTPDLHEPWCELAEAIGAARRPWRKGEKEWHEQDDERRAAFCRDQASTIDAIVKSNGEVLTIGGISPTCQCAACGEVVEANTKSAGMVRIADGRLMHVCRRCVAKHGGK